MPKGIDSNGVAGRAAHRPSRRAEIVQAATDVFSRLTYTQATVEHIAAECGVRPTAVYYHFGGKEQLFDEAFGACLLGFSAMLDSVSVDAEVLDDSILRPVIDASWMWLRMHPVEARLLTLHLNGATPQSRRMYETWQERYTQRVFDYLPEGERAPRGSRKAREQYAVRLLAFRFLGGAMLVAQDELVDGSLGRLPTAKVEQALVDLLTSVVNG